MEEVAAVGRPPTLSKRDEIDDATAKTSTFAARVTDSAGDAFAFALSFSQNLPRTHHVSGLGGEVHVSERHGG